MVSEIVLLSVAATACAHKAVVVVSTGGAIDVATGPGTPAGGPGVAGKMFVGNPGPIAEGTVRTDVAAVGTAYVTLVTAAAPVVCGAFLTSGAARGEAEVDGAGREAVDGGVPPI